LTRRSSARSAYRILGAGPRHEPRKAEIAQFDHARARYQQILRLDVAVNNLVAVAIVERAKELIRVLLDVERDEAVRVLLEIVQNAALHVLEYLPAAVSGRVWK
jgi:hypothetical protein